MANQEHLDLLKQGVEVWNQWRKEHRRVPPDLSGADLVESALSDARLSFSNLKEAHFRQAHLHRAYFVHADLSGANLREALLLEAHLNHANLAGANLSGAQLQHANIRFADLSGANLSGATLRSTTLDGAKFSSAHLRGSDLSLAQVGRAAFDHVDLSTAKGLETMIHKGPSLLGLHTLALSYRSLPETFLEGTGVTEILLAAVRTGGNMLGAYRTCLVCYARSDLAFAEQLLQDLQAQGVVCESLPYDKEPGTSEHMIELCSVYDQLLLLLSDQVVIGDRRHEQFCGDTLYLIQKWHGGKTFRLFLNQIVPLLQGFLVPRRSRTDQDFTDWREPERYQHAFDRLLRNLKGEA